MGTHSGEISQLQPCFTTWSSFALSATLVLASCTTPTALCAPRPCQPGRNCCPFGRQGVRQPILPHWLPLPRKAWADADADASLVHYPNGAVVPYNPYLHGVGSHYAYGYLHGRKR